VPADRLRAVCGALLEAPQFLLQGIAGSGGARPVLTPPSASYAAICGALAAGGIGVPGRAVRCGDRALALERR
jgi:hypothetical protein